jgi:steroid 5-alpha reductase family enzyme
VFLACLLPTLLGFYKSEYGVSFGYGLATAISAGIVLQHCSSGSLAWWHAAAILFYGIRLSFFLLYRQLFSPRFQEMVQRIENKANARGGRLSRTPFILSCASLYFGLVSPAILMCQYSHSCCCRLREVLISLTWLGFLLGAAGDFNKSIMKAKKGDNHLVTEGVYKFLRHPNYTGEVIGWTSSFFAGLVAAVATGPPAVGLRLASFAGVVGIDFVLCMATRNLESKQKEVYGETDEYTEWIQSSWAGFRLPAPSNKKA